ncbi:geranylgeranylglyceryl/heptaprenylglyceryl phosphate synthase [Bacteroidota bacterium]
MISKILTTLKEKKVNDQKSIAILIDPDKIDNNQLPELIELCDSNNIDFLFVGGSLISNGNLPEIINSIKILTTIPVVIFPGSNLHVCDNADAILFLTLISGRNPEYLIGQHVVIAPVLKESDLEILPTGYILVDGGIETSVSYLSGTKPIPSEKPDIARATAIAGELLGLSLIYLEAGSGASNPVSQEIIQAVDKAVEVPIIVGGGLNSREKAWNALASGADLIVIGNGIESDTKIINEVSSCIREWNTLDIH